jgi:hypothetical protein
VSIRQCWRRRLGSKDVEMGARAGGCTQRAEATEVVTIREIKKRIYFSLVEVM